ncbi:MAG: RCC1-like domain-containing protein [Planctomycetota bacterium]|jgi:hypothetical protein
MSPGKKLISGIVLSLVVCPWSAAALPDTVRGVKVSGGEEHTVVLTAAKAVWACGNERIQKGFSNFFVEDGIFLHFGAPSFVFI